MFCRRQSYRISKWIIHSLPAAGQIIYLLGIVCSLVRAKRLSIFLLCLPPIFLLRKYRVVDTGKTLALLEFSRCWNYQRPNKILNSLEKRKDVKIMASITFITYYIRNSFEFKELIMYWEVCKTDLLHIY